MNTNISMQFVKVDPATVQRGDTIFVSTTPKSVPYFVIDIGNPFFMLENSRTHFASLYHAGDMYKQVPIVEPVNIEQQCQ